MIKLLPVIGSSVDITVDHDPHDYGCIMVDVALPTPLLELYHHIDSTDVVYLEDCPHCTIVYGLIPDVSQHTWNMLLPPLESLQPLVITGVGLFQNVDYDVLKFNVECPSLVQLHDHIRAMLPNYKQYECNLHITIAKVKTGRGQYYLDKFTVEPTIITPLLYHYSNGSTIQKFSVL